MLRSPAALVALGFGAGLSPIWPGTVGSLLGVLLGLCLQELGAAAKLAASSALLLLGIIACSRVGRDLGDPDHRSIVIDEVWGMAVVIECAPRQAVWIIAGFLAFRLFDTLKPWPIGLVHGRMRTGCGTMADDLLASLYAVGAITVARATIAG